MDPVTLDELDAVHVERGYRRHPTSGAPIVTGRDGKTRTMGSPSGLYKAHCENTYNLQKWSERRVVAGMALLHGLDVDVLDDAALDALAVAAKDEAGANIAARRGTHAHLLAELDDLGASWIDVAADGQVLGLPTVTQAALVDCWRLLVERNGLEILMTEQAVVCELANVAGTLDRVARTTLPLSFMRADDSVVTIPAGTVLVLDVKTGQLRVGPNQQPRYWSGYALQVLLYAMGEPVTVDQTTGAVTYDGWPDGCEPSTEHALIAHLDVAGALDTGIVAGTLVYVDLVAAAAMLDAVEAVRYVRKLDAFGRVGRPSAVVDVEPSHELTELWLQDRVDACGADPRARALLLQHWPRGMASPKQGVTPEQVPVLTALLDRVEAEAQLPFGRTDPRAARTGHHHEGKQP